jgi:hypothetical protein
MKNYLIVPLLLSGLSACSLPALDSLKLPSLMGEKKSATMASATGSGVKQDPMRLDTIAFADAYCRKDGMTAVAATQKLVVAHPNHPRARLNYGLALDLAGRGVAAYTVLDRLAKGNHPMPAVLRCGDDFRYSGTVTEVAQRRAFNIKTTLIALGMTLPPPSSADMKAGSDTVYRLASLAPAADEVLPVSTASRPHKTRPARAEKHMAAKKQPMARKGRHFVHLGSYKSSRTLDRGWRSLRKRFGKILGAQSKAVSEVNLGRKKGRYLRLGVSVPNVKTARSICKRLKAGGQYCVVRQS